MSATYYLILTAYGAQRIAQLQADQSSAPLLVNFVAGDANGNPYLPQTRINATALIHQRVSVPLQSVNVVDANTCQAVAVLDGTVGGFNIHEIGITDSTGQLVYIGNYHGAYKPTLSEGAGGDLTLVLDLVASGIGTVIISPDPSFIYAGQDWVDANFVRIPTFNAHVAQNNLEHNNLAALIATEAQVRFDVDQYLQQQLNTHIAQNNLEHNNLAALITTEAQVRFDVDQYLQQQLNTQEAQNTLEHNNLLAMIQAVNQRVSNLEIREEVQIGEFIITDDPRNPVLYKGYGEWRLVPNVMLSGLDLGGVTGQVRQIAVGAGQNVRTTFFWRRIDPNAVLPTRTITIAEDAFELSLRDLFEAQYGEPVIGEQVNFVIADGVLVTAYNTSNHAIVTGDWPPQTALSMDNYGIVSGRGGRGGTGLGETTPPEAKHGFDGGPAILATYPLALNNLNTVSGGGAGGGASANWRATAGTASAHIGNVGGSGGAPYGEAGDLGVVNEGITDWGAGLAGNAGGRTTGGAAVTRTETRVGSTLNHFGGTGGGLGQNGGMGSGSGSRTGGEFYPNEWRAGGVGGLAGVAITGPVAVTGNPPLGR